MGRPPKARSEVLRAAQRIVVRQGTGALTFDTLSKESGVTRGGITYHFPTKQALLKALVELDIAQWEEAMEQHRPSTLDDDTADLVASIRVSTDRDEHRRRFISGMLSAAMLDPTVLDPVREYHSQRFARDDWDRQALCQLILRLAADGLFWTEMFDCHEWPDEVRERLVALMEELAIEWSQPCERIDA